MHTKNSYCGLEYFGSILGAHNKNSFCWSSRLCSLHFGAVFLPPRSGSASFMRIRSQEIFPYASIRFLILITARREAIRSVPTEPHTKNTNIFENRCIGLSLLKKTAEKIFLFTGWPDILVSISLYFNYLFTLDFDCLHCHASHLVCWYRYKINIWFIFVSSNLFYCGGLEKLFPHPQAAG